ncbi:MAG: tetratricopeptide repeat protein [Burkholderiales bacterium]|nr:tetratricopeptide repeat protein [Burkholderiales bacterium]
MQQSATRAERAGLYTPRILQQHLVDDPDRRWWAADGTVVFVDISGFTKLSERLARKGREGSEQITDVIGRSFESILAVAYDNGASLLKFGGDALLLWFQDAGHATRACRAAVLMRRVLREVGRIEVPGAKVTLRMSQGVHSGLFHFFAVGATHFEMLPVGPAWSRVVEMEHAATAGEILVSTETVPLLPARCLGKPKGPGVLLAREPAGTVEKLPLVPRPKISPETLERCLPPAVRAHVLAGGGSSEHRPVTIAFIRYEGTDALISRHGPDAAADALHRLVAAVDAAADEFGVALLASDVDADGGKLILTAGAPTVTGDDEERMLLALRKVVDAAAPVSIRIGVNRGSIFAGDIGPFYRRTYTVMGDAVNLAARLMAKAEPGHIYATADVLDRSNTLFATTALEPFMVKGKAQPIQAWAVGPATGSRARQAALEHLPLTGRDAELALLRDALAAARAGSGRLVDVVGEAGVGKTRLIDALREGAGDFRVLHAVCEAYTASKPYAVWQELLREASGFGRDATDDAVEQRLRETVASATPHLRPWVPLIGFALGLDLPATPEVEMLAEKNRRPKLHEAVENFVAATLPGPTLFVFENAHHIDPASAELLAHVARNAVRHPWLVAVARRPGASGAPPADAPAALNIELAPLAEQDARRLAQIAAEHNPLPPHVLDVVAARSGGNPQFLRDLLRAAIVSGGVGGLPDSAEAATMARIDALRPEDRVVIRRAAVFGLTFHPRMLAWLETDDAAAPPDPGTWARLSELFEQEDDGYVRFRRSLLRDAAYEGLPYKLRRQLHGAVATRMERELAQPDEEADLLSLHFLVAGEHRAAWRYATVAAKHALGAFAFVEAARMYARALEAGRRVANLPKAELATAHEALADCLYRVGELPKASDAYSSALRLAAEHPLHASELLLKRSKLEEKLGKYPQALRWAARAGKALAGAAGDEPARQAARTSAWYATVLQAQNRPAEAIRWAARAIREAEAADDPEALGAALYATGYAYGVLGKDGAEAYLQRALDAYRRSGNLLRQAALLSNLGVICQWEGRWDEALAYYERGRAETLKLGNTFDATIASMNIAEILSDRGELDEAQRLLLETLPVWRASRYRFLLGGCLWLLGRVSLRAGRLDEALARLEEAHALFLAVKREEEALDVDARIAECRTFAGAPDAALALAADALARAQHSKSAAKAVSLLERVRGHALLRKGDVAGAQAALTASLAAARARRDLQETALALHSLCIAHSCAGEEPPPELAAERDALVARLAIRALPPVPTPAH